jgi:hypothetical protein
MDTSQLLDEDVSEDTILARIGYGLRTTALQSRSLLVPIGGGNSEVRWGQRLGINDLRNITTTLVVSVVVVGAIVILLSGSLSLFAVASTICYIGLLSLWVWDERRLLYPIYPFIIIAFLTGIYACAVLFSRSVRMRGFVAPWPQIACLACSVILLALSVAKSYFLPNSRTIIGDLALAPSWLQGHVPVNEIVAARYPEVVFLYSGRKTVYYPELHSISDFQAFINDNDIGYFLIEPARIWSADHSLGYDEYTVQVLIPMVEELVANQELELIYMSPDDQMVKIYRTAHIADASQETEVSRLSPEKNELEE